MWEGNSKAKVKVKAVTGISQITRNADVAVELVDDRYEQIEHLLLTAEQARSLYLQLGRLKVVKEGL